MLIQRSRSDRESEQHAANSITSPVSTTPPVSLSASSSSLSNGATSSSSSWKHRSRLGGKRLMMICFVILTILSLGTSLRAFGPFQKTAVAHVQSVRGIHRFRYNMSANDATPREVHVFPVAHGIHFMAVFKDVGNVPTNHRTEWKQFYTSRFVCLCVDMATAADSYHLIMSSMGTVVQPSSDEVVRESRGDSSEKRVLQQAAHTKTTTIHPSVGHHTIMLADGNQVETRVLAKSDDRSRTTLIGLCDPSIAGADNDVEELSQHNSTTTMIARITSRKSYPKHNKRSSSLSSLAQPGSCADMDSEVARVVLRRNLLHGTAVDDRGAFYETVTDGKPWRIAETPSPTPPKNVESTLEAAELSLVCNYCGGPGNIQDGNREGFVFRDPSRFRPIFFERSKHSGALRTLRAISTPRWPLVSDALASDVLQVPRILGAEHREERQTNVIEEGIKAMDNLAAKWDPLRKAEHLAQCLLTPTAYDVQQDKKSKWSPKAIGSVPSAHLQLQRSQFFQSLRVAAIPSRIALHPLPAGGHTVCLVDRNTACDQVAGNNGAAAAVGDEPNHLELLTFALTELRRLTRLAASILAARHDQVVAGLAATNDTAVMEAAEKYMSRGEFALGPHVLEWDTLTCLNYSANDVLFMDISRDDAGATAASIWSRGFRTEVYEALPQNIFLLESSRCTNQAEKFAEWEEMRAAKLQVSREHTLPKYYRAENNGGPWLPRWDVRHAVLSRGGSKGCNRQQRSSNDSASAVSNQINEAVHQSLESWEREHVNTLCVLVSFGDATNISLQCDPELVQRGQASQRSQQRNAAAATSFTPRGFVNLTTLDRVMSSNNRDEHRATFNHPLENIEMKSRFQQTMMIMQRQHASTPTHGVAPMESQTSPSQQQSNTTRQEDTKTNTTTAATDTNTTATTVVATVNNHDASSPSAGQQPSTEAVTAVTSSASLSSEISSRSTTAELLAFVSHTQVVMHVSLGGEEDLDVLMGAKEFLSSSSSSRPKFIVSRFANNSNHIERYGAYMMYVHGYTGLVLGNSRHWLRTTQDVVRYQQSQDQHNNEQRGVETIVVWVDPLFKCLIPPIFGGEDQLIR